MNAFTSYLEKLGSNFLVSAMIPSLALVIAGIMVFEPILKLDDLLLQRAGIFQIIGGAWLLIVPTVIIGFTLTALNTFILKVFEGYVFLHRFTFMRDGHVRKAQKLIVKREALKRRIFRLEKRENKTSRLDAILEELKDEYYQVASEYDNTYPPSLAEVLPTKFGNILKASESYPGKRYGLDGVEFWPRLVHVIAPQYQQAIDAARNELSFLVNMSLLSAIFFLCCVGAILYNFIGTIYSTAPITKFIGFGETPRYFMAGVLAMVSLGFFNRASLFSVGGFGIMIRSAYDLFRLDLLKQFRLKAPGNSVEEFDVWRNLNELITLGEHSLEFVPLEYDLQQNKDGK